MKRINKDAMRKYYIRRDLGRTRNCLGCKFNRYNYPDELTAPPSPMPTDLCWFIPTATIKHCVNKQ